MSKLKHLSGFYRTIDDKVTDEDVLYHISLKPSKKTDILKAFSESKKETVEQIINELEIKGKIKIEKELIYGV